MSFKLMIPVYGTKKTVVNGYERNAVSSTASHAVVVVVDSDKQEHIENAKALRMLADPKAPDSGIRLSGEDYAKISWMTGLVIGAPFSDRGPMRPVSALLGTDRTVRMQLARWQPERALDNGRIVGTFMDRIPDIRPDEDGNLIHRTRKYFDFQNNERESKQYFDRFTVLNGSAEDNRDLGDLIVEIVNEAASVFLAPTAKGKGKGANATSKVVDTAFAGA